MAADEVGPRDVVDLLRDGGVAPRLMCIEPTVTLAGPDGQGWMSLVPRIDDGGHQWWHVLRHIPERRVHWASTHAELVDAVELLTALYAGISSSPQPAREPPDLRRRPL